MRCLAGKTLGHMNDLDMSLLLLLSSRRNVWEAVLGVGYDAALEWSATALPLTWPAKSTSASCPLPSRVLQRIICPVWSRRPLRAIVLVGTLCRHRVLGTMMVGWAVLHVLVWHVAWVASGMW